MWYCKMTGIIDLTCHACQKVTWAKSISMGDRLGSNNNFSWDKIVLKFSGTNEYACKQPLVFNQRVYGLLNMDFYIYVDDG